jgi:hypothetical protein
LFFVDARQTFGLTALSYCRFCNCKNRNFLYSVLKIFRYLHLPVQMKTLTLFL